MGNEAELIKLVGSWLGFAAVFAIILQGLAQGLKAIGIGGWWVRGVLLILGVGMAVVAGPRCGFPLTDSIIGGVLAAGAAMGIWKWQKTSWEASSARESD
jgi:hypothetical protein